MGSNDNKKNFKLHKCVAETFIDNPDKLPCVNHKDGDKLNNNVSNLEWCTIQYNALHAIKNNLYKRLSGEESGVAKLTNEDVLYIREVYIPRDKVYGGGALGLKFNVRRGTILDIVKRITWNHL